ncbi:MEI2-like protein 6, partial [Tanacetum coccineum]
MANQTCSKKHLNPYAPPYYPSRFNHHHASRTNCTSKWSVHFLVATGPRNCVVPNRKPKDKPRFNEGAKRLFIKKQHHREIWKSHVCITRKSWPLFKSKKIAQVVRAGIQGKNSLVKHFEDMRLCRPSKEYLQVKL